MSNNRGGKIPAQARGMRTGGRGEAMGRPFRNRTKGLKRNEPCPCGSGTKFKKCCGVPAPVSRPAAQSPLAASPYRTMQTLYTVAQQEAELAFTKQWGFTPDLAQLQMFMEGDTEKLTELIAGGVDKVSDDGTIGHAVRKLGMLITPANTDSVTEVAREQWEAAIAAYKEDGTGRTD